MLEIPAFLLTYKSCGGFIQWSQSTRLVSRWSLCRGPPSSWHRPPGRLPLAARSCVPRSERLRSAPPRYTTRTPPCPAAACHGRLSLTQLLTVTLRVTGTKAARRVERGMLARPRLRRSSGWRSRHRPHSGIRDSLPSHHDARSRGGQRFRPGRWRLRRISRAQVAPVFGSGPTAQAT